MKADMPSTYAILMTVLFCVLASGYAAPCRADDLMDAGRAETMGLLLDNAIRRGLIDGGVVVVGDKSGPLYTAARGRTRPAPDGTALDERTIFDVASLTKVIATAPAIMKLLEEGRLSLVDPITRWFPEFEGTGREEVTILNLLTHTSGFDDVQLPADTPLLTAIRKASSQISWKQPGSRFRYADINFILLGELIQRVSGMTLDRFCRERLYAPAGMGETTFLPPADGMTAVAPTFGSAGERLIGIVQDENARRIGGVAGHAGLFTSASDLTRFAGMILGRGMTKGGRIFDERTVIQMTAPYYSASGSIVRGLGWDISSPFSSPRGSSFSDASFGHTGYSGSSIWIDPDRNLFVILLTIRKDYRDTRLFNRLRSGISTIAASVFSAPRDIDLLADIRLLYEPAYGLTR